MSSTGPIESWNINPINVGPISPFAGWEALMFAVCVAFCAMFMAWKFLMESAKYAQATRHLRESNELAKALANGSTTPNGSRNSAR